MTYPYAPPPPRAGGLDGVGARPQLGPMDVLTLLSRELWLMAAVFVLVAGLGIGFALTLDKEYQAEARLSVLLGEEYVFTPRVGAAAEGASPKQEQIVQSEVEILTSAQVVDRVVRRMGLERLYGPEDIKITQGPDTPERRIAVGVDAFRKKFGASATPNTTVIRLGYANRDPDVAAEALNRLIDEYLIYRREVLFEDRSSSLQTQRDGFEGELDAVQREIGAFLAANQVADFEAERASIQGLLSNTRQELLAVEARREEAEGRASATADSWSREPLEVRQSFESDVSRRRIDLQSQLAELLTRYTEDSQPVRDLRRRIAAQDELLGSEQGRAAGVVKTGPNPVRDSLATDRARANAEVAALVQREAVLAAQVAQLQARAVALAEGRPQFEDLQRRKAILEEQVRQFSSREAAARAQTELNRVSNDNIRVIERAKPPTRGRSLRRVVALGALGLAGISALFAGLMRAFARSSFPTPGSVGRTLGLPVLATVSR
jgi:uncharacterized protein involved in exopolysaccharide biosynthesis